MANKYNTIQYNTDEYRISSEYGITTAIQFFSRRRNKPKLLIQLNWWFGEIQTIIFYYFRIILVFSWEYGVITEIQSLHKNAE